ncbi:protein of unknown function [Taphrina deformans PYCC 5710]|uniref:Rab-GAP TBC domain-containing protein n=1 Tax=Taphrina deformans (strain PYCC 5710 / ATCC 11124 / CBS 356.35 / IMI 108563 / JCM 9778 / NBRC 8474) TaxID=1097556 RepID=R4XKS0_TAPDE|nr:protein of unknown function [Taphrina deformans PYCC 5710]|eukprot:CCG83914.1 protein of unknown function [Taphrina deformans PYCC 5710]
MTTVAPIEASDERQDSRKKSDARLTQLLITTPDKLLQASKDVSKDWSNTGGTAIAQRPLTPETSLNKSDAVFSNDKSSARLLMLSQLDVYGADKARQEQWDAFIQKTREDRFKARSTKIEHVDEHEDELLGLASMGTGKMGKERLRELHNLVLGGIPMTYRPKIWNEMTGAYTMKEPAYYEELLSHGKDVDVVCVEQIDLDLKRTMPSNVFFAGVGTGVAKLRHVLLAYSRHNSEVGYCQGMNVIAGILLLIHPKEEDAFFALACIVEKILPPRYFTPDLLTSRADQIVLKQFVKDLCPKVHKHMKTLSIDLEAITFGWFLSVFTDCLPVELLFRIWDIFFLEGRNYLFCVAITIIKIHERSILQTKTTGQGYILLKELTAAKEINVDEFVKIAEQVKITLRNKAYDISQLQKNAVEQLIPPSPL